MPDTTPPVGQYDNKVVADQSPGAAAYRLKTNGTLYAVSGSPIFYITNTPTGVTVFAMTALNSIGESAPTTLIFTNPPPLTNVAITVTSTYTWAATNPPGAQMFFALCSAPSPTGPWKPVPAAPRTNMFPSGVNIATKTNFN